MAELLSLKVAKATAVGSGYILIASEPNGYYETPSGGASSGHATVKVKYWISGSGTPTVHVTFAAEAWITGQYGATKVQCSLTASATIGSAGSITASQTAKTYAHAVGSPYNFGGDTLLTDEWTPHANGSLDVTISGVMWGEESVAFDFDAVCSAYGYQTDWKGDPVIPSPPTQIQTASASVGAE